jgi:hypothetical protein
LRRPLDRWAWFLRHAEELDATALPASLAEPEFQRAMEELTMVVKNDREKQLYEARERQIRDEQARWQYATEDGLQRGELMGRIKLAERLLGMAVTASVDLKARNAEELRQLAEALEQQLAQKLSGSTPN